MSTRFLVAAFCMVFSFQAHAEWVKLRPLPQPAGGFVAGAVQGKIVLAGGTNWPGGVKQWLDTVWLFDPGTNEWRIGPRLPHALAYAAFASDGERLYFAGGGDGSKAHKEIYALDETMHLTHVGDLPEPVMFNSGTICDGVFHSIGGTGDADDLTHSHARHFTFALATGKVVELPQLKGFEHGVRLAAMTTAGSRAFAATGCWFDGAGQVQNVALAFVHAKEWRSIKPYPLAARGVSAVTLDDSHIYFSGGYGAEADGFLAKAWVYDVKADRYEPSLPQPMAASSCLVACGEHVYYLGGEDLKKHRSDSCFRISVKDLSPSKQP